MGQPLSPAAPSHRLATLASWNADWSGLRVAVVGLDEVGFSVVDTLVELGADVDVIPVASTPNLLELATVIGARIQLGVPEETGLESVHDPELLIASPRVPRSHPALQGAVDRGLPIWSDVDLAWRVRDKSGDPARWLTMTGGSSTSQVAYLTASMLREAGLRAAPAGGAGVPVLDAIRDPAGFDVLAVELSSRQLHWVDVRAAESIAPEASLALDVAADPSDWHEGAEAHRAALAKIYENTRLACVYNLGEPATRDAVEEAEVQEGARAIGFGLGIPGPSDVGVVEGILVDRAFLEERRSHALELATTADLAAAGLSTREDFRDVLAAAALARAAGVEPRAIREGILNRVH
ncbi:hypothetical protein [uncultured Schumannella sp.]|uniref:hypothetical protein n=1 Tax=uncultured Schumannella sp. TaxID=1195956 RepID=UPI0025F9A4B0|nr:hypothetical protein [uncultured Schumannella sp.]